MTSDQRGRDIVAVLTNIPNPYNGYLYDGLRDRFDLRIRYEGLPSTIGRPWDIAPERPDRVADHVWDERDAWARPPTGYRSTVVLCGWATPRNALRRAAASVASRGPDRRVVYWGERMNEGSGVARRAYFSAPGLDAVLAIGSHAVASYREATGGRVPIHVFPYTTSKGYDVDWTEPDPVDDEPAIGFVGRLVGWKNVDVVVRAVAQLPAAQRPTFEILGSGPEEGALKALADQLGAPVRFLGEIDPAEVAAHRRRWAATVQPSKETDGWALAVTESLNGGIPVIASDRVGAAVDLIRPGRNGLVIPRADITDPGAWADAIAALIAGERAPSSAIRAMAEPFLPDRAARWLADLLGGDLHAERSFVDDGWACYDAVAPADGRADAAVDR